MNSFDITQRWLYSEKWLLIIVNSWYITNNHRSRMDINEIMWGQQLPRPGKSHPWKWWWLGFPTANARSIQKTRTNTWRTSRICIAYRTMHERHFQAIPALPIKNKDCIVHCMCSWPFWGCVPKCNGLDFEGFWPTGGWNSHMEIQ